MRFGTNIRFMNGNEWHVGAIVANYGNGIWGVTHVLNPVPNKTSAEFRVREMGGMYKVIDSSLQAPPMINGGGKHLGDLAYGAPGGNSVGAGAMLYREQYKTMKTLTGR